MSAGNNDDPEKTVLVQIPSPPNPCKKKKVYNKIKLQTPSLSDNRTLCQTSQPWEGCPRLSNLWTAFLG